MFALQINARLISCVSWGFWMSNNNSIVGISWRIPCSKKPAEQYDIKHYGLAEPACMFWFGLTGMPHWIYYSYLYSGGCYQPLLSQARGVLNSCWKQILFFCIQKRKDKKIFHGSCSGEKEAKKTLTSRQMSCWPCWRLEKEACKWSYHQVEIMKGSASFTYSCTLEFNVRQRKVCCTSCTIILFFTYSYIVLHI